MNEKHPAVNRDQAPSSISESQALANEAAGLEARLAEIKQKQEQDEAWGKNDWAMAFDESGKRTDYRGFKDQWAESINKPHNLDASVPDQVDYKDMTYPAMIREARRLNELNDKAGVDELWNTLQDKLVEQADAEDWSESNMYKQLDYYEKHLFPEQAEQVTSDKDNSSSNEANEPNKAELIPTPAVETADTPEEASEETSEEAEPAEEEAGEQGSDTKEESSDEVDLFDGPERDEFLKYIANGEKGHFNKGRLKVDGKLQLFLRTKFGKTGAKLADKLTRRTPQEEELAKNYTESLKTKEVAFLTGFEPGTSEYNARKAEFVTSQHAADALRIAEIQKEDAKKPTNKWLRRAGFVGAGLAGGIIAATPIGWAAGAGAAVALGGAGAIQVHATRRNALTQEKDSENLVVDQLAKKRTSEFNKNVAELQDGDSALGVESLADEHLHGMNSEVEKNRKRMRDPIGAAALAYGATFGTIESIQHLGGSDGGGGEHHPTNNPTESQTEAPDARLTDPVRDGIDEVVDELPDANQGPIDMPTGLETIDTSGYNYPWNWAAEQFGEANAMSELHRLGEIASQNGYEVFWHSLGDGNELNDWISIDGMSDTDSVVNILNQFR